jgi:hypothetical protein
MTTVELEPIALTEHGQRYRVTYAGAVLVEGRRNPIFDACRALLARGITVDDPDHLCIRSFSPR